MCTLVPLFTLTQALFGSKINDCVQLYLSQNARSMCSKLQCLRGTIGSVMQSAYKGCLCFQNAEQVGFGTVTKDYLFAFGTQKLVISHDQSSTEISCSSCGDFGGVGVAH